MYHNYIHFIFFFFCQKLNNFLILDDKNLKNFINFELIQNLDIYYIDPITDVKKKNKEDRGQLPLM